MSDTYTIYRASNIALMRSLIMKHQASIDALNYSLKVTGNEELNDKATWKYYMNLAGEYHPTDDAIYVTSYDTKEVILFDKDVLNDHPLTRAEYDFGTTLYYNLIDKYPDREMLITGVLHPVDKDTAINAEDYEILYHDSTLVADNETNLIPELQRWIYNFKDRWDVASYAISDNLYPATFLGILFMNVVQAIENIRLNNCNTPYVSEWHLWSKLGGYYNLDEFRDNLTLEQALWLYKNIDGIKQNVGANTQLDVLIEKIAKPRSLIGYQYDMVKVTENQLLDNVSVAAFNSSVYGEPNNEIVLDTMLSPNAVMALTENLAENNLDTFSDDVAKLDAGVNLSPDNEKPTPIIRLSQAVGVMGKFDRSETLKMDNWIYLSALGYFTGSFNISIPGIASKNMSPLESLILFVYSVLRGKGFTDADTMVIPKLLAYGMIPEVYPDEETIRGLLDPEYMDVDKVMDTFFDNPLTLTDITTSAELEDFAEAHNRQLNKYYFAREFGYDSTGRAIIEMAAFGMLDRGEYNLVTDGTTFGTWIDEKELVLTDLTNADFLALAENIISAVPNIVAGDPGLTENQRAMVEIINRLTSMNLIVMEGDAYSSADNYEYPFKEVSDYTTLFTHYFYMLNAGVQLNVDRALSQSVTSYLDVGIGVSVITDDTQYLSEFIVDPTMNNIDLTENTVVPVDISQLSSGLSSSGLTVSYTNSNGDNVTEIA